MFNCLLRDFVDYFPLVVLVLQLQNAIIVECEQCKIISCSCKIVLHYTHTHSLLHYNTYAYRLTVTICLAVCSCELNVLNIFKLFPHVYIYVLYRRAFFGCCFIHCLAAIYISWISCTVNCQSLNQMALCIQSIQFTIQCVCVVRIRVSVKSK